MKGLFLRLAAIGIASLFTTACGSDDGTDQANAVLSNPSGSFLTDYITSQDISPAATGIDISGTWSGLLYCAGRDFPIDIIVDSKETGPSDTITAVVSISPMIGKERVKTPFYREHVRVPMNVSYASDTHMLKLVEPNGPDVKPRTDRRLFLRALVDPVTQHQMLLHIGEMQGERLRRSCDFGVVGKDIGAEPIAHMAKVISGLYGSRRPIIREQCPPAYERWVETALALPQTARTPDYSAALEDDIFIPAFGKAYQDISADELLSAGQILLGSCGQFGSSKAESKKNYQRVYRATSYLNNHRYYQSVRHTKLRTALVANWIAWMNGEIDRQAPINRAALSRAADAPRIFTLNTLNVGADKDFTRRLLRYSQTLKERNKMLAFVRGIEDVRSDFKALIAKHQVAEQHADLDAQVVSDALDYYLAPAAKQLASEAQTLKNAVYMATWSNQIRQTGACPAASDTTCETAASVFETASDAAAETFAKTLEAELDDFYPKKTDIAGLAQSVKREAQLRRDYGVLYRYPAFKEIRSTLEERRRGLQERRRRDLVALAENTKTAPDLNAIQATYFLAGDLEQSAMKTVANTLADALAQTSPFTDIYAADYFNALFNKDFATLRRLDAYYLERMRPLMDFGTQQIALMGPLLDAISGSPPGTTQQDIRRSVANLSALYAVMGTYLIEYQSTSKACLERDAVTFRISKRTDLVTTDGFGNEIKRTPGWTTADDYTINREFRQNFQSLFGTASGTGTEQLFDMFLNDGRVTQIRSSTRKLMRNYECNSRAVQQLEAGMIAYDRDVTRRMRGG